MKNLNSYIGCDETGVGDYLAPLIASCVYINNEILNNLSSYKLKDSKQLKDNYILEIGKIIKQHVISCTYILKNISYNKMINSGYNSHAIKTFLHNKCICNLIDKKKINKNIDIIMDKYVSEYNYIKYLKNIENKHIPTIFLTKAESVYKGVALASILSRYELLKYKEKFYKKYKLELPLGASKKVDQFSKLFIERFGLEEFKNICKFHFSNTKRVIL